MHKFILFDPAEIYFWSKNATSEPLYSKEGNYCLYSMDTVRSAGICRVYLWERKENLPFDLKWIQIPSSDKTKVHFDLDITDIQGCIEFCEMLDQTYCEPIERLLAAVPNNA